MSTRDLPSNEDCKRRGEVKGGGGKESKGAESKAEEAERKAEERG